MQDVLSQAKSLKRPDLLVRAARFGVDDYNRERTLKRCLKCDSVPGPGPALISLLDIEKQFNSDRITKAGGYQVTRHIELLTAITSEAELFRATRVKRWQVVSDGAA